MDNRHTNEADKNSPYRTTGDGEGYTMLNISGRESARTDSEIAQYLRQGQSGANWFFLFGALSMVNTIVSLGNGSWSFLAGLGITQFIAGFAKAFAQSGGSAPIVIALLANAVAAGVFVLFGLMARRQQSWAFIVGMACYAADGLIFVLVQDWLSIAFHLFALYCISKGFIATNKLRKEMTEGRGLAKGQSA